LFVLSLAAAIAAEPQQPYLPWEQQTDVGSIPAWYAPKTAGFASPAGSSMNVAPPFGSLSPSPSPSSSPFAARPSYPPNFPGYPTFGTVQPVGGVMPPKSGGIPYSFTTTYKPKSTTGSRPKPTGKSNLDKYLPLMKKKKASSTTTTSTTVPSTTKRRKLPARRTTVTSTKRPITTTKKTTTVRPTTTTVVDETEWESLEIVESTTKGVEKMTSTIRSTTERKEDKKMVKGPIITKGRSVLFTSTGPSPPLPSSSIISSSISSIEEEEKEAEFNLLAFLWDKSELLASIKNMIKQLKSSIDEAGLEEDVKQVSDHFKNTIKTFASASPVNEQLGRLFERAQNSDV
ncbi:hypothetical protein PMAYCL1PPCAC_30084, partial [Pristionchus mayeri]